MYVGIDLSTNPKKAALAVFRDTPNGLLELLPVSPPENKITKGQLAAHLIGTLRHLCVQEPNAFIGIDVPFGWPIKFCNALHVHSAQNPFSFILNREQYLRRYTETWVKLKLNVTPQTVAADKIGSTAMFGAHLLSEITSSELSHLRVQVPGTGPSEARPGVIEVYPKASLVAWAQQTSRVAYKDPKDISGRDKIWSVVIARYQDKVTGLPKCPKTDDEIDGYVCALTAYEYSLGGCTAPLLSPEKVKQVEREGWIWFPNGP